MVVALPMMMMHRRFGRHGRTAMMRFGRHGSVRDQQAAKCEDRENDAKPAHHPERFQCEAQYYHQPMWLNRFSTRGAGARPF
ncbi:hypothetical protein K9U33_01675 [Rhodoblastus acidophilus]|uniref:Secreted protein n=1 Tax=Candidatus Rhodoblastus alkanivorans TaxID=2954117 RepID=A0ABS9Z414_9HYPH|nr:hypothetical protein [Candidatus Rhodoblastus alkanivorans]MCI4677365.1 hypothetical protein [Candidatus Rhodoblastus alkanivorans]MCI4682100.1 hypothetical protein [Candidatus Rhodoblastus alkanivorans]